jgi:hypothetical protein
VLSLGFSRYLWSSPAHMRRAAAGNTANSPQKSPNDLSGGSSDSTPSFDALCWCPSCN